MAGKPSKTRLDTDATKPPTTAPGDAPHDTTDPAERATSVQPQPGPEALAEGRVNAAVPLPQQERPQRDPKKDRVETYEATGPDGKPVKVTHNIDTGETTTS
jgi:hypothetical protein